VPATFLSALAGVTRTVKFGTLALPLPLRNPAYLAKEWATLDLLSSGRSISGIGIGWQREFELMGAPPREHGARMDEMIEAVCLLWSRDRASFAGKHFIASRI
jgi:alkanesulfonate monooxygenase SsuD/methylene tetrahydromethanopterin reductase-like flavin-dependent oxidoreductase (luciferase family)